MNKGEWGKIKAFFDVTTEEGFVMKGFKLVQGINGLFVGFPSQKGSDEEYYDTIYAERELKDELSQMAIDYYGQEIMPSENMAAPAAENNQTESSFSNTNEEKENDKATSTFTDDDIPF